MKITSPAFTHNEKIPAKYTCDGEDKSPPLKIAGVPANALSLVLISDDPDAPMGTWVHWLVWNLEPSVVEISENTVPSGGVEGTTSWKRTGYGGPCPPSGIHRYFFKIYALDCKLDLKPRADIVDLERAMEGHVLDQAELIGLYSRG